MLLVSGDTSKWSWHQMEWACEVAKKIDRWLL